MWKHFWRLFVQNSCYACGRELTLQERCICLGCLSQIPPTQHEQDFCANELYMKFAGKVPLAGAYSMFYFEKKGRLQKIMQQLKYERAPQIGIFLGELLATRLQGSPFLEGVEALIPVPLHKRKHIHRGYNQSERIATGMSKVLGISVEANCLGRRVFTQTQTAMSRDERWENVKAAFEVLKPPQAAHVLLIDDVITTGATLEACIRSLLACASPPERISIASVGLAKNI
ncbi:MAG: ComF family protein [Bacteroidetes bacterium]|nr:MAG: ComF family protein [Bacteroidota bacterium]